MIPEPRESPAPPRIIQNVYAFGGFAYGAINADVHVFGDGRPVYTLAEHHSATGEPNPRWRRQPSSLLDAGYGVVPFTGREAELRELAAWRDQEDEGLALRWVYGPGGRGKTRLADQFAALSAEVGWKTVEVHRGGQITPESQGSHDAAIGDRKGLLVLIDYADRWPLEHLTWLFANRLFRQRVPVRVLFVARTVQAWQAVHSAIGRQALVSAQCLDPLPDKSGHRERAFDTARSRFCDLYDIADPRAVRTPRHLGDKDFGLTLTVHMSALVAVDAHATGRRMPDDAHGLSAYLLNRERENWTWLHQGGKDFDTEPETMAKVVYTAALTGALGRTDGVQALGAVDIPGSPQRLLTDHATCYPPSEPDLVLEPLYPDRLAEDFVALLTPGHGDVGYATDAWAASAPTALLSNEDRKTAWTPHAVTVLAATAGRWPHLAANVLYPLLRTDPGLALAGGNAALTAIAFGATNPYDEQVDPGLLTVLEAIEPLLPDRRRPTGLSSGALAIVERLTAHRLASTSDKAERASLLFTLGLYRMDGGHIHAAVRAYTEVVALERELDRGNLLGAINNLGLVLHETGRGELALDALREGVDLCRERYASDPESGRESLATSLTNLSRTLAQLHRWDQALAANQEALDLLSLAGDAIGPLYFRSQCLLNRTVQLAGAGREPEALASSEQTLALTRELYEVDPDAMRHQLAVALVELGIRLTKAGRDGEALEAFEEAVPLYYHHDERQAAQRVSGLVLNFGTELSQEKRHADAAVLSNWSYRLESDAENPESKAAALVNSSAALEREGRIDEAIAASAEAVEIFRESGSLELEGASLVNLGSGLLKAKRFEEAVDACERAITLVREHGRPDRADREPTFNLAKALSGLGRHEESIEAARRAAAAYENAGLHAEEGDARSLLGDGLSAVGRKAEAVPEYERAAELYSDYDRVEQGAILGTLSAVLFGLERFEATIDVCREAEAIFRAVGDNEHLPLVLTNRAGALASVARPGEAVEACREAIAISRDLGDDRLEAMASRNLGGSFDQLGRKTEAVAAYGRSAELLHRIGDLDMERETQRLLGTACLSAERFGEAVTAFRRMLAIPKEPVDRDEHCRILGGLAAALSQSDRHEEAIVAARQSAAIAAEDGSHDNEGFALEILGDALVKAGRTEEVIDVARRIVAVHRRAGNLQKEAVAQRELSTALGRAERFEEAAPECGRAAALFRALGDAKNEDQALRNQMTALYTAGERHLNEGRFEKAVAANREAAELCRARYDIPVAEGSALLNLGFALGALGRHAEVVPVAQRAAMVFRQMPDRPVVYEGRALRQLGETLLALKRFPEAVAALLQAVDVFEAVGDREAAFAVPRQLVLDLIQESRYEEALPVSRRYFQATLAAGDHAEEVTARIMYGAMLVDTDRLTEGIAFNLESADRCRRLGDRRAEQLALQFAENGRRKQRRR